MAFNGNEGTVISLGVASDMTKKYRNQNPNSTNAHFFGKEIIQSILDQEDCVGIRFYYGINENDEEQLVLAGVRANEDDITGGIIADVGVPCPHHCGNSNLLNS